MMSKDDWIALAVLAVVAAVSFVVVYFFLWKVILWLLVGAYVFGAALGFWK
jgi:hypothetical protein